MTQQVAQRVTRRVAQRTTQGTTQRTTQRMTQRTTQRLGRNGTPLAARELLRARIKFRAEGALVRDVALRTAQVSPERREESGAAALVEQLAERIDVQPRDVRHAARLYDSNKTSVIRSEWWASFSASELDALPSGMVRRGLG